MHFTRKRSKRSRRPFTRRGLSFRMIRASLWRTQHCCSGGFPHASCSSPRRENTIPRGSQTAPLTECATNTAPSSQFCRREDFTAADLLGRAAVYRRVLSPAAPPASRVASKKNPAQRGALLTHSLLARFLISVATQGVDGGYAHIAAPHGAGSGVPCIRLGRV